MKVLKWALGILLILAAIVGMKTGSEFFPLLKGAFSVQKLDEGLYCMEFHGDDGFDGLLEQGGGRSSGEMVAYINGFLSGGHYKAPAPEPVSQDFGCSALTVTSPEGGALMGRNFDFASATGMIVHSYPKNGYESVSTFNTEFLGMGEGWLPEGFKNQYISLACLFFALDGINEKGLAVADLMAGDDAETHQDTGKPALTTTSSVKYLLNKAATVEEALELLKSIDMHSDIGSAHHLAISDASGRSVVVEYVDNRMVVVESPAVANHYRPCKSSPDGIRHAPGTSPACDPRRHCPNPPCRGSPRQGSRKVQCRSPGLGPQVRAAMHEIRRGRWCHDDGRAGFRHRIRRSGRA